jgi:transcriptional regulator with XRE-family HTH domain
MSTNSRPSTLGGYVRQERERAGLSIRQLAAQVGMHHSRLARLERGEVGDRTTPEYIQGIADALGIDVTKLLRFSGVKPKPELPTIKMYFRRKLGVDADEADVLAQLIVNHQASKKRNPKGGNHEPTTQHR